MARKSLAYDQAHNPTQLANELRAAGLDAQVSDRETNRFWINAAAEADEAAIAAVVAAHVPSLTGNLTGDVTGDVSGDPVVATKITLPNGQTISGLTTAITANSTLTDEPDGSIGVTSHATGKGKLFMSDGTKWQFAVVA